MSDWGVNGCRVLGILEGPAAGTESSRCLLWMLRAQPCIVDVEGPALYCGCMYVVVGKMLAWLANWDMVETLKDWPEEMSVCERV